MVLVSFGEMNGALRWYKENQIENALDLITDQDRKIYKLFNLKKSYSKVWCTDSLVYYAEQLNFKRQLPKAYEDVEDDPHQMGGNIVLQVEDSVYKAVYIHRSKSPPDRPTPNELIDFIQKCLI